MIAVYIALTVLPALLIVRECLYYRHSRRIRKALAEWSRLDTSRSAHFFDAMYAAGRGDKEASQRHLAACEALDAPADAAWLKYKQLTEERQ